MIAKTAVVRVFGYGHQLNGVVAGLFDAWQDIGGKFIETGDLFLLATHTNMRLVN